MNKFFNFQEIRSEIKLRNDLESISSDYLWNSLIEEISKKYSLDFDEVNKLFKDLNNLNLDYIYPNYLNHPIRVSAILACFRDVFNTKYFKMALCHNIFELIEMSNKNSKENLICIIRKFFTIEEANELKMLYTDRTKEHQSKYQENYINNIYKNSEKLFILKACDKLDNHLSYTNDHIEIYHYNPVTKYLIPRLKKIEPILANYLEELINYDLSNKELKSKLIH